MDASAFVQVAFHSLHGSSSGDDLRLVDSASSRDERQTSPASKAENRPLLLTRSGPRNAQVLISWGRRRRSSLDQTKDSAQLLGEEAYSEDDDATNATSATNTSTDTSVADSPASDDKRAIDQQNTTQELEATGQHPTIFGGFQDTPEQGNQSEPADQDAEAEDSALPAADHRSDEGPDLRAFLVANSSDPKKAVREDATEGIVIADSQDQTKPADADAAESGESSAASDEAAEEEVSDAKKVAFEQVVNQTIDSVIRNRSNLTPGSNLTFATAMADNGTYPALEGAVKQAVAEASANPSEAKAFTQVAEQALAKVAASALITASQDTNSSDPSTRVLEPQQVAQDVARRAMLEAQEDPVKMEVVKELVKQFVADAAKDPEKMKALQNTGVWALGQPEAFKEKAEKAEAEKAQKAAEGAQRTQQQEPAGNPANVTQAVQKAAEKAVEKAMEKVVDSLEEKSIEKAVVVEKAVEKAVEQAVENIAKQEASEKSIESAADPTFAK